MLRAGHALKAQLRKRAVHFRSRAAQRAVGRGIGDPARPLSAVSCSRRPSVGRSRSSASPRQHLYITEVAHRRDASARRLAVRVPRCRGAHPSDDAGVHRCSAFWIAGAIALARGLRRLRPVVVTHDIGLVEYSIFVPLVASPSTRGGRLMRFSRSCSLPDWRPRSSSPSSTSSLPTARSVWT